MRRCIRVLWIDDEISSTSITVNIDHFKGLVEEEFNYECRVFPASCMRDAVKICKEHRIHLIISDYNLSSEEKGLDFLVKLRKGVHVDIQDFLEQSCYFILYSNNDQSTIIKDIVSRLEKEKQIHLFSNFDFFSTGSDIIVELERIMEFYFFGKSKVDELRNIYIVDNAIWEDKLKIIYDKNKTYGDLINKFCKDKKVDKAIKNNWINIKKKRNTFAHGKETFDNGKIIIKNSQNNEIIDIKKEWEDLLRDLAKLNKDLKNFFT